eukprot:7257675-Prymnesium_polylepis.1
MLLLCLRSWLADVAVPALPLRLVLVFAVSRLGGFACGWVLLMMRPCAAFARVPCSLRSPSVVECRLSP